MTADGRLPRGMYEEVEKERGRDGDRESDCIISHEAEAEEQGGPEGEEGQ